MITKFDAIISLVPEAQIAVTGNNEVLWIDPSVAAVTDEQIQNEVDRLTQLAPFNDCKLKAKQLIAATDWAALPDVGLVNQSDFIAYRSALRALIINPVANPVWPTEPTPEWG